MRLREHGDLPHQSRPIPFDYPSARQQTRRIARGPSAAGCGNILTARVTRKIAAARINSNCYPHSQHRSSASLFSDQDSANAAQQRGRQREQIFKRSRTPLFHNTHLKRQRRHISSQTKHLSCTWDRYSQNCEQIAHLNKRGMILSAPYILMSISLLRTTDTTCFTPNSQR